MKGKILRFSKWNPENQRTAILIKIDGNGEQWFEHFGTRGSLIAYKIGNEIEFTAEQDKITSMSKITVNTEPTKQEPVLTPKAHADKIFSNETSIIQLSNNIVNHFITKNEGTKTMKKDLLLKVYEQIKLDERTRLINELRKG